MDENDNINESGTSPSPEVKETLEVLVDQKQETDEEEPPAMSNDTQVNNNEKDFMLKEDKQFTQDNTFDPHTFNKSYTTGTTFKERLHQNKRLAVVAGCVALIVIVGLSVGLGISASISASKQPRNKYPICKPLYSYKNGDKFLSMLGDGNCDRYQDEFENLNSKSCGYDAGDCDEFNKKYEDCVPGTHPSDLDDFGGISLFANETCQYQYNTEACGFDDGLCIKFNLDYPDCETKEIFEIDDGRCGQRSGQFFSTANTKECGWEGGDCLHRKYPNCTNIYPPHLYDDVCHPYLNRKECNFDNEACIWFNDNYPNCNAPDPNELNNQKCNNSLDYNNESCGYDGGDCIDFNKDYPDCKAVEAHRVNDTICDNDRTSFNSAECGFDGGDCDEFNKNELYTECDALNVSRLGDGNCDGALTVEASGYNSEQCAFDGGDCVEFNKNYPDCPYYSEEKKLGDGRCDYNRIGQRTNSPECNFDGGDCVQFEKKYPDCHVTFSTFSTIGDGKCDSRKGYDGNTAECGFEDGDCIDFNKFQEEHPDCSSFSWLGPAGIGDGKCESKYTNIPQCGFDGGDCVKFNEDYPGCKAGNPYRVGDGECEPDKNTPECEFDGGDCLEFNSKYPDCKSLVPAHIGDQVCNDYFGSNTLECDFDGGDCLEWNKYPDCRGDSVNFADGHCDFNNDNKECDYDGGDCN